MLERPYPPPGVVKLLGEIGQFTLESIVIAADGQS